MYDPKSMCADDFINHEEILETLEYAQKNKDNLALINEILERRGRKRKEILRYARDFPTGRRLCFWPVRTRRS